jgi:hypothetical protein
MSNPITSLKIIQSNTFRVEIISKLISEFNFNFLKIVNLDRTFKGMRKTPLLIFKGPLNTFTLITIWQYLVNTVCTSLIT